MNYNGKSRLYMVNSSNLDEFVGHKLEKYTFPSGIPAADQQIKITRRTTGAKGNNFLQVITS